SFASGADVGWLPQMEASGFVFKNKDGKEQDCLVTLKEYGLNSLRLRSWVNPSDDPRRGHCSTGETLAMALRGKKLGFRIMIDFHYGDSWCDPGNQKKPAAWRGLSFDKLTEALSDYTRGAMKTFLDGGFIPDWVQLGNETNPGMLLPDGSAENFSKLTALYNAGHDAVKEVSPATKTIIHLAEGNNTEFCRNYFDQLAKNGCRYDMIGLSYYPWWLKKKNAEVIGDLALSLRLLPERFNKDIMVVETGGVDEEEEESRDLLLSVIETCSSSPRCKGIFYWEPEGAKIWSAYNLSAWRADGTPTRAMDAYLSIKM
ncbi:MAG: glycosyl hydrolase 53 family protein, partial [Treponema sp.]|nr:glycosyl hydrolase 53 family protein [Treponema sp.]